MGRRGVETEPGEFITCGHGRGRFLLHRASGCTGVKPDLDSLTENEQVDVWIRAGWSMNALGNPITEVGAKRHRDRDFAGAFPSRQKRLAGMGPLVVAAGAVEHGNGEEQRPTGATGSG